ncbi:mucin protein [Echinococcus multilocularis]|uniref:Mucin protein n=1 Tax=Echinococcus multilocularis TaxID=6211 RepID=A0A068XTJ9_ECHMU|nr:mucin protein [Echinococcus multilocularis]
MILIKDVLLFLAETFHPQLAQCLKICGAEAPCELSVEEGIGRSAPEAVAVESSGVQHLKQFLLFLAETFYPQLAQCLKICGAEAPCELSVEEGIGRSAPEAVAVESSGVQHLKQFLLFLAETFYPQLAQCLKICGAEAPCELSVEEGIGRSAPEAVAVESSGVQHLKQFLLFLAETFYPQLAQCLKICGAEAPCELSVEEGIGRSAPEAVAVESSGVQHLKQFLLFLAETFYPQLAQCLKICGAEAPCELSVEEGIGRSAPEAVAVESSGVQHLKQFLLFLAETFYPQLAQCLKICGAEAPCELSVEEGIGRSAPEAVAVESSGVQHLKKFLLFLADTFYPELAPCLKIYSLAI